jgi:hypothetical protein
MRTAAALWWVLPFVLALGVIGMHNMVTVSPTHPSEPMVTVVAGDMTAAHEVAAAAPSCCEDHNAGDHLLHLCLAVLVALGGLIVGWLLWRRGRLATVHRDRHLSVRQAGRGPPHTLPTPARLASLCVLRL